MFRGHIRRSGPLRIIFHERKRRRRRLESPPPADQVAQPQPTVRYRYRPTEAEWQSGDPGAMLRCVVGLTTDRGIVFHMPRLAVQRKLRLFYCACCRLRWDLLPVRGQQAVGVIEQFADGQVKSRQFRAARRTIEAVIRENHPVWAPGGYVGTWDVSDTARLAVHAAEVPGRLRMGSATGGSPASDADQVPLLRELFNNPFRPIEIANGWLTSNVVALALAIHTDRAFELMPVLGDALQEAGCNRSDILEHCYGPGPHVAGCWLLDRLTGRDLV